MSKFIFYTDRTPTKSTKVDAKQKHWFDNKRVCKSYVLFHEIAHQRRRAATDAGVTVNQNALVCVARLVDERFEMREIRQQTIVHDCKQNTNPMSKFKTQERSRAK